MGRVDGKVAVVTGASSGIGRAVVERFAAEGAKVLGVGRSQAKLDKLRADLGSDKVALQVADLSQDDSAKHVVEAAKRELAEEAGLQAGRIERLAAVYNTPGYCDQRTTIFLATDLESCASSPDGVEERWMRVERIALDEVDAMVADGRLVDATTVAGLLFARGAFR